MRVRFREVTKSWERKEAGRGGFEPPTTGFGVPRSAKLSYRPINGFRIQV